MNNSDQTKLYTVAEYSDTFKISKQAVYKKLNGALKDRKVVIDDVMYIKVDIQPPIQPVEQPVEQPQKAHYSEVKDTQEQPPIQPKEQPVEQLDNNSKIIEVLTKQLEEKDKLITVLTNHIDSLSDQNKRLTDCVSQYNFIQAQDKMKLIESETHGAQEQKRAGLFGIFKRKRV